MKNPLEVESDHGVKHDDGKDRWDLLPVGELTDIVKVLTYGARKYSAGQWMSVPDPINRYYAAMMRHIAAWRTGEIVDMESELPHLAHAGCCLLFLMWFDGQMKKGDFFFLEEYYGNH